MFQLSFLVYLVLPIAFVPSYILLSELLYLSKLHYHTDLFCCTVIWGRICVTKISKAFFPRAFLESPDFSHVSYFGTQPQWSQGLCLEGNLTSPKSFWKCFSICIPKIIPVSIKTSDNPLAHLIWVGLLILKMMVSLHM